MAYSTWNRVSDIPIPIQAIIDWIKEYCRKNKIKFRRRDGYLSSLLLVRETPSTHCMTISFEYDEPGKESIILDNDPFGDECYAHVHQPEGQPLVKSHDYWRLDINNPLTFDHVLSILDACFDPPLPPAPESSP